MRIIVAVSGGIDSLYTLISLKNAGHDVAALHARFINTDSDPSPALSALCRKLEIPFYIADLRAEFIQMVVKPFLLSYQRGQTPNPCAICNKLLKFGRILEICRNYSAEFLATGHYACLENYPIPNQEFQPLCLKSAKDKTKNQSYFLALTPATHLRHCLFPLADKNKKDIETELEAHNISVPIPKESQEICFIPNDNYREFIENNAVKYSIEFQGEGDIILLNDFNQAEKKLGTHNGLWNYTEGQRKGIGIAYSEPLYVIKKDYDLNILYVGKQDLLTIKYAYATDLNFFIPPKHWPKKLFVKTRYKERITEANIFLVSGKTEINLNIKNEQNQLLLAKLTQDILTIKEDSISENKLFHVLIDDQIFSSQEEEFFFQEITAWNTAKFNLKVEFKETKQVYAKGQILAIYDENEFILAGGVLI